MYAFIDNPFIGDDSNGGEPGGNIRTAFLYRTDRVDLVDNSLRTIGVNGVSIDTPGSAGAIDQQTNPDNPFFGSRPPLVATFEFNGNDVTIVNNHFTSKGGSGAVFGSVEPPLNASEVQRAAQAQAVNNFVDNLLAGDANAKVMVAGDLNEFPSEEPMSVLKGIATITNYDVPASDPFDATATYVPGGTAILHDLLGHAARRTSNTTTCSKAAPRPSTTCWSPAISRPARSSTSCASTQNSPTRPAITIR